MDSLIRPKKYKPNMLKSRCTGPKCTNIEVNNCQYAPDMTRSFSWANSWQVNELQSPKSPLTNITRKTITLAMISHVVGEERLLRCPL